MQRGRQEARKINNEIYNFCRTNWLYNTLALQQVPDFADEGYSLPSLLSTIISSLNWIQIWTTSSLLVWYHV